jgi:hypothetical protein
VESSGNARYPGKHRLVLSAGDFRLVMRFSRCRDTTTNRLPCRRSWVRVPSSASKIPAQTIICRQQREHRVRRRHVRRVSCPGRQRTGLSIERAGRTLLCGLRAATANRRARAPRRHHALRTDAARQITVSDHPQPRIGSHLQIRIFWERAPSLTPTRPTRQRGCEECGSPVAAVRSCADDGRAVTALPTPLSW